MNIYCRSSVSVLKINGIQDTDVICNVTDITVPCDLLLVLHLRVFS